MTSNRRRDTRPEVSIRRLLHARGLRFRVDYPIKTAERAIRADIAFPKQRVAVFIDGCFWHGCPDHGSMPKRNRDYWKPKLERNRMRDTHQTELMEAAGWMVLRRWTHEKPEDVLSSVLDALDKVNGGRS